MRADEFAEMRARPEVPHDDEITWDAHDRVPQRSTEFTGGMAQGYCLFFVLLPVLAFILAYFLQ